jgi:hypothetical protein
MLMEKRRGRSTQIPRRRIATGIYCRLLRCRATPPTFFFPLANNNLAPLTLRIHRLRSIAFEKWQELCGLVVYIIIIIIIIVRKF